jgi:diguanylate cyclase (GGDEF)-like protein
LLEEEARFGTPVHAPERDNPLSGRDEPSPRRRYVDGAEPCLFETDGASPAAAIDAGAILAGIGEAAYDWHIDTDALLWGTNAVEVLTVAEQAAIATGRTYAQLVIPDSGQTRFDAVMRATVTDQGPGVPYQIQYALRPSAASDDRIWIEDTGRWFAGADGRPARAYGVVRAINERHAHEERLAFLSRFDRLTGEMNRWYMSEMLQAMLEEVARERSSCGFLLVAIDNLGRFNEAYGFDVADEVIGAVGKRIRAKLRGCDCLARYSGNKFGVILKNCTPEDLLVAAERLLTGVRESVVETAAGPVAVTVTIGGVTAPRHARTVREVLARAQEALDAAKARRQGSFQAYRPDVEREAQRRRNVRSTDEILAALNERRVSLAYEPVIDASTRQPAFYECLLRVHRPDGSLIPTQDLVPLAERLGLVRLLDHRVLELVIGELAAAPALRASLNVSAASTIDPDWWGHLGATLQQNAAAAERLTVEITETAAIQDIDDTRGFVARVKDLGCRIAIDDFGAGYTSFRNLRRLGVDMVKIDGAFVQNLTHSEDDRAFVQTLIDLGRRLGLKTVAEWVQDEESAVLLTRWGCDYLQGALVGLASHDRPWAPGSAGDPLYPAQPKRRRTDPQR